jgi:Sec-independent protein translocase protein TatA
MNFLGIGPLELLFIGILLLIIFGPKDLQSAGKTIGQALRKIVRSDTWKMVNQTSKNLRDLPNQLIHEADLEEIKKTIGEINPEKDLQGVSATLEEEVHQISPDAKTATPNNDSNDEKNGDAKE